MHQNKTGSTYSSKLFISILSIISLLLSNQSFGNNGIVVKIAPQKDGFGADNPQRDFILIPVEKELVKQ